MKFRKILKMFRADESDENHYSKEAISWFAHCTVTRDNLGTTMCGINSSTIEMGMSDLGKGELKVNDPSSHVY